MHCTMMYSPTVTRTTLNMAAAIRRVQERRGERFKFIESERLALTEVQSEMQIYAKWDIQTLSSPLKCIGITCFHSARHLHVWCLWLYSCWSYNTFSFSLSFAPEEEHLSK